MLKVIKDLDSIMVECYGIQSEAARRLDVNRGSLNSKIRAEENAYIVVENGDVYKRTGNQYLGD